MSNRFGRSQRRKAAKREAELVAHLNATNQLLERVSEKKRHMSAMIEEWAEDIETQLHRLSSFHPVPAELNRLSVMRRMLKPQKPVSFFYGDGAIPPMEQFEAAFIYISEFVHQLHVDKDFRESLVHYFRFKAIDEHNGNRFTWCYSDQYLDRVGVSPRDLREIAKYIANGLAEAYNSQIQQGKPF